MAIENVQHAIDAASEGNGAEFQNQIHLALMDKVTDRLDLKRVEIASSLFATPASAENEAVTSEEPNGQGE